MPAWIIGIYWTLIIGITWRICWIGIKNILLFLTSKASKGYTQVTFAPESFLVFGRETSGLPDWVHAAYPDQCLRIPMLPDPKARCLNLSNAVAVVVYEAFRQQPDFGGLSLNPSYHSGKLNSQYE